MYNKMYSCQTGELYESDLWSYSNALSLAADGHHKRLIDLGNFFLFSSFTN